MTIQTDTAAKLVAEGRLAIAQIALKVGVDRRTIQRWRRDPDFVQRTKDYVKEIMDTHKERDLEIIRSRAKLREHLYELVKTFVGTINEFDLYELKKTPATAINLFLRLEDALEKAELKNSPLDVCVEDSRPVHDSSGSVLKDIAEQIRARKAG